MALKAVGIGLKIFELIILLAATGLVGYFFKEIKDANDNGDDLYDAGYYGRYEFYLYTSSVGAIIAIAGLVALVIGLCEKSGGTAAMVPVHALWALQLLVSSALLAKILAEFEKKDDRSNMSACDMMDEHETDYQCNQLIGGVACGFLGTLLFIVDAIVYLISSMKSSA